MPLLLTVSLICSADAGVVAATATTAQTAPKTIGEIVRQDERLSECLAKDVVIEVLAEGFDWTEGPVWMPGQGGEPGFLLFSEIPSNTVRKWSDGEGDSVWMRPSGYTGVAKYGREPGSNGLMLDAKGRLTLCEHGDRRVSVLTAGGGKRTLADNYEGLRFNSPNDLCFASDGTIFFTDPPYGLPEGMGDVQQELDFCGVYRLNPDGAVTLLTKEFNRPNGIGLSPDGKTLYVNQSDPKEPVLKAFDLDAKGDISDGRVLHDFSDLAGKKPGLPDGMAVDDDGRIWATGPGGVTVLLPDGTVLGRIDTKQATANCCFGGDGGRDLFITADMFVVRVKTKVKGHSPF